MAKKKVAAKRGKTIKKKQTKRAAERVLRHGQIRRRPKTLPRPGMEDLGAVQSLDRVCSTLADIRHDLNELRGTEKEEIVTALREMRKANRQAYKSHGIELVRVAGDEKVRVRLVKGEGAADVEDEPDTDTGDGDLEAMDSETLADA